MLFYLLALTLFFVGVIVWAVRFDRRRKGVAQELRTHDQPNLEADLLAAQFHNRTTSPGAWRGAGGL